MKKVNELKKLTQKYYGYVVDLEASRIEILDLLFVRDKIQDILEKMKPDEPIPQPLYEWIHTLDARLWQEKHTFLMVIGQKELEYAREQQESPRSYWWWYLDEFKVPREQAVLWKREASLVAGCAQA